MIAKDILTRESFAAVYAQQGNPVARDIYASMGYALSCWEHCETSLASLFTAFAKPTGGTWIAFRAYGAVMAHNSRRDMIAGAAEAYFSVFPNDDLYSRLTSLLALYQAASGRRNDIAHAVVMSEPVVPGKPDTYFLMPSFHASRKQGVQPLNPKYRYSTVEIDHYAGLFGQMGAITGKLMQDVRAAYEALPEKLKERFP